MFNSQVYTERRKALKAQFREGVLLFFGNKECPMNYAGNPYRFRQDSTFSYYFGLNVPDLVGIMDVDSGEDIIYGNDAELEDIIWMGSQKSLSEKCSAVGVKTTKPYDKLAGDMCRALAKSRRIHFLPPYHEYKRLLLGYYNELKYKEVEKHYSVDLIRAVVSQRSVKDKHEIAEIENTLSNVTYEMYQQAMKTAKPGNFEYQVAGRMEGVTLESECTIAYPVTCSVNGEVLHNHYYGNKLKAGDLLLIDAGAQSPLNYATDITRTLPVGGKFSDRQKEIYDLVLKTQEEAIKKIKPGVAYKSIHLDAAKTIAEGLKGLGLMKGDMDEAVAQGAHALFLPHGLGHMLGLDVHDMEDLGEDYVGYDEEVLRSNQFGLSYLRFGKKFTEGNIITVEPGIYFIPALLEKWKAEKKFIDFINYNKAESYLGFGGIRIEDDVLVTSNGQKVLGKPIPKTITEIEKSMA